MKFYDLSVYWESNPFAEPWPPKVEFSNSTEEAVKLAKKLDINPNDFQDGQALAVESVSAEVFTHVGTHCDAPIHFGPTTAGQPSRTIDELPLEDFYGDGVILDMRHKDPRSGITVEDVQNSLSDMEYTIKPKDIVLIMTGYDKHIYNEAYLRDQPGMTGEATEWLIDQGVKLMGIDAYTFDRPFGAMVEDVKAGNKSALFPAHFIGRKKEYYHIEKLGNLDKVPVKHGFKFCAFPIKVKGGTAGSVRAVAMID
ncbi:cyclase family protein [Bacillus sp. ISL-18]|uniref:cyclase family protein n=1 Tax=Bacillus sp. ISL-18 TaxID=2819118 RepID=UPI001BE742FA|nr:cyclase family protein [Bacillus sp. ISL-18]MBT2654981.1 cyclase family protein [Bacillus sp. ISL-18]